MAEAVQESELGRSKQSVTPREHLLHLLNIGWSPSAPLIQKYVLEHGLRRELEEFARNAKANAEGDK